MANTETVYDATTGVTVEAPAREDRAVVTGSDQGDGPTLVPRFDRGNVLGVSDRSEPTTRQMRKHNVSIFAQALQMRAEKLAGAVTGLLPSVGGFDVLRRERGEQMPVEEAHPWRNLIHAPNSSWSAFRFWRWMNLVRDMQGHSEAVIERDSAGRPVGMWPVYPDWGRMRKRLDRKGQVIEYVYDWAEGGTQSFEPEDILRLEHPDPVAAGETASLLERGVYELTSEIESKEYEKTFMENGRPPNFYIKLDVDGNLTPAQPEKKQEAGERMRQGHMGSQANNVPVLTGGEFKALSIDPDQLQMLESREMRKDDIFSITGVPPAMMGKDPTNANVQGATRIFATMTLQPLAVDTASEITQQFEKTFRAEEGRLLIQAPNTVPTDEKEESLIDQRRVRRGVPPGQIMRERGEEIPQEQEEELSRSYIPKGLVPISRAGMVGGGIEEGPPEERELDSDTTAYDFL